MAHGLPKPDAGLWGVDSLCSPMHMYKVLLSSAHQGTTDSLLTRWGAGSSLLAHGGIFKWSRMVMAPTRLGHSLELDTP